ncbi:MAG: 2-oxoacid:acceptor oxidoreductase family protein [Candidatus Omnitrophota bacterium]|nr:2-oxoacid:acceptor oxidoreductase family protein [Candidatus Omnitrophota bacterium]
MLEKIIIAGSGGQGIMFMGKILALAALKNNFKLTLLPAYGAEVRGGTSNCSIVISDEEIASPFINQADTIIVLNEPSLNKFKNRIKNNGLLVINTSLIEDKSKLNLNHAICLSLSDIASSLGEIKVTNMVALGAYIAAKKIISFKNAIEALRENTTADKKELFLLNERAIKEGMRLVKDNK